MKNHEKKFYSFNNHKYNLLKNYELLYWLMNCRKRGYNANLSTKELQEIIDKMSEWYLIKYPNHYFNDNSIDKLTQYMTMDALENQFNKKQVSLIKGTSCKDYESLSDYIFELELRDKIFELITMKLFYYPYSDPKISYQRVRLFNKEISRVYNHEIDLSKIEDIMSDIYPTYEDVIESYNKPNEPKIFKFVMNRNKDHE